MGRSRSRSPRKKERRRSRSRERESEKKLDKFGRDVTRIERHSWGARDEPKRRDDRSREDKGSRDYGRDYRNREDDRREREKYLPSDVCQERSYDPNEEQRQEIKEMFAAQEEEMDDETRRMQHVMGIGRFDTSKNKKHSDGANGYVKINKPRKYRQYMNRRGGFNRPLDWVQ